ncbi:hypothetical protein BHZ80_01495 [Salmonella enterica]|nr:hypothetical protein [Salmonella enterica]EAA9598235.1 hypothetical protein [Salmonella enterica]EAO9641080.1 hypothetical protein [Salmonella enterica]ECG1720999.1 hypothetical protein [Salmonella enterica subsp. diarizonae serovar 17:z10:e,n,x,z15]EKI3323423.1 hypothetical protein [Salmonella enterica]
MCNYHVQQPCTSEGCGVAVMARLLRNSYEEALAFAFENGFCDKKKRVNLSQMKRFLTYLGQENVSFKKHDGASALTKNCICHGRWDDRKNGTRHWIAFYEGVYFDPLSAHPEPELPRGFYVTQIFKHP